MEQDRLELNKPGGNNVMEQILTFIGCGIIGLCINIFIIFPWLDKHLI